MGIVDHAGGLFENKMYKKGDVVKILKYKKAQTLLNQGWIIE